MHLLNSFPPLKYPVFPNFFMFLHGDLKALGLKNQTLGYPSISNVFFKALFYALILSYNFFLIVNLLLIIPHFH